MEPKVFHCPSCGASLDIPQGCSNFYCTYCGSKVVLPIKEEEKSFSPFSADDLKEKLNQAYRELVVTGIRKTEFSPTFNCSEGHEFQYIETLKEQKASSGDLELFDLFDKLIAASYARMVLTTQKRGERLQRFSQCC